MLLPLFTVPGDVFFLYLDSRLQSYWYNILEVVSGWRDQEQPDLRYMAYKLIIPRKGPLKSIITTLF